MGSILVIFISSSPAPLVGEGRGEGESRELAHGHRRRLSRSPCTFWCAKLHSPNLTLPPHPNPLPQGQREQKNSCESNVEEQHRRRDDGPPDDRPAQAAVFLALLRRQAEAVGGPDEAFKFLVALRRGHEA